MRVQTAIAMLRDHGFKAFQSPEGVTAIGKASFVEIMPADDCEVEANATFETYTTMESERGAAWTAQHVDGDAIRTFCGY